MELLQRGGGVGYVVIVALLAAHWANAAASAYRRDGGYDELFGRPLGEGEEEEEVPLLKATSPKISLMATTHSGSGGGLPRSTDASGLGGAAVDATLLSTMVTEFLASTAQTPNKEEEAETAASAAAAAAAALESPHLSPSEQTAAAAAPTTTAATTATSSTTLPLSSTATTATSASLTSAAGGDEAGRRRIITYDQRQEGQYNVRADLENFMIVLIPPTSVSDSLLDLLRKQQQRQSTLSALKRQKLKHHHGGAQPDHDHDDGNGIGSSGGKYQHSSIKIGQSAAAAAATGNYLAQQRPHYGAAASGYPLMPPLHVMHPSFTETAGAAGEAATDKLGAPADFIEGRTPYRVDISASDDEQSHLHLPERQQQQPTLHLGHHGMAAEQAQHVVDVLPPPYTPLAYQHLMKPYLEPDAPFPPSSEPKRSGGGGGGATSGNFLETYSQLLNAGLVGGLGGLGGELGSLKNSAPHRANSLAGGGGGGSGRHGGYYRMARSILGYDGFKGNQLDGGRSAVDAANNPYYYPLYRSDHSLGAAQRYPPLDLPRAASDIASGEEQQQQLNAINADAAAREGGGQPLPEDVDEEGDEVDADEFPRVDDLPLSGIGGGGYDYDAMLEREMQSKRLLERCSPGQRRDSYGLCRKIDGY